VKLEVVDPRQLSPIFLEVDEGETCGEFAVGAAYAFGY
jgi:hypothetical protein